MKRRDLIGVIPSAAVFQAEREPALSERSESNGGPAHIATLGSPHFRVLVSAIHHLEPLLQVGD